MKLFKFIILLLLFSNLAPAQTKNKIAFNSYNAVGFVAGKSPIAFCIQTENGLKWKQYFAGIGVGVDNYYWKTIPFYFAAKRDFKVKTNIFFIYANTGTNFISQNPTVTNAFTRIKTTGNFYWDLGLGYKLKLNKNTNLFFSLGNSQKEIHQLEESLDTGFPYSYKTTYKFSRIAFKIGIQL